MKWLTVLALVGCSRDPACGLAGAGPVDPDRDPVEFLADYDGPAFSELQDVEVDGDTVWFCSGVIGLNAYDASNPERLKRLDDIAVSVGSSVYPRCQHLALAPDGTVYLTNRGDSIQRESFLAAVDGSNPGALTEIRSALMTDEVEGLTVDGPWLYVAAHASGLLVVDRTTLRIAGRAADGLQNAWQVRVSGSIAWVADGEAGLVAMDITDPTAPVRVGSVDLEGQAKDLEIRGSRAWVALGSAGIAVVDLSEPTSPRLLDSADTPGSALGVAATKDAVYVSDWNDLRIFDITDPDRLRPVGHEPLRIQADLESRSLGIAAGRGDLLFSGNWTALSSYRYHSRRSSGDLDPQPARVTFPRTQKGDTSTVLLTVHNAGSKGLSLEGATFGRGQLDLDIKPGTLAPGESATHGLSWTARSDAPFHSWLNLLSDDADEPRKCVPLEANLSGVAVGDIVSGASFVGLDGTVHRVDDHRGQVVMLAYFATF